METKAEVLQRVLSTELLGESAGKIAGLLGLNTRATLYRIKEGTATEKTAAKVMELLEELPGISEELLQMMSATIRKYEVLADAIKDEKTELAPQEIVADILAGDYSRFSEKFRTEIMPYLETLRKNDSTSIYYLLAYFYVRKSVITFYRRGMAHIKRCRTLLTPLTEALSRRFPENIKGGKIAHDFEDPDLPFHRDNTPTMLSCVRMISYILMFFGEPEQSYSEEDCVQLYGTEDRIYWVNREHTQVVLAIYCESGIIEHRGYYTLLSIDAKNNDLHIIGRLSFYDDYDVALQEMINKIHWGTYEVKDGRWVINWNDGGPDDIGMGNFWEMADPRESATLTAYDSKLSDDKIWETVIRDNGLELLPEYEVEDVTISRHEVTIHLENGRKLTIDRGAYHFFEHLSPDYPLLIARNVSDGVVYAIWGEMVHMVPLSAFR